MRPFMGEPHNTVSGKATGYKQVIGDDTKAAARQSQNCIKNKQEVKVIWQKAPHGGPIPRLGVTPWGRKLYHWIPGVGVPISVP